jgi:hypothetical protein
MQAIIKFYFLQGKALKEIHTIMTETLRVHAPLYATLKHWVAQFKLGIFPPVMHLILSDLKQ